VFDDILRAGMVVDLGAQVAGSLGLSPSAEMRPNVGPDGRVDPALKRVFGIYEPSHGTVEHRVGRDQVNPIATILSAVDMFRYSLDLQEEAEAIEQAMVGVIGAGYRTYDIMEEGTTLVSSSGMAERIATSVRQWPAA
jgi:3-isopropylmalate dehydrogenase